MYKISVSNLLVSLYDIHFYLAIKEIFTQTDNGQTLFAYTFNYLLGFIF